MSSDLCKCGNPKRQGGSMCKACHNARMKERQRAEVAGEIEVGLCPKCKAQKRVPGQSYCRDCKRERDMWAARRRNGVKPENYQGHRVMPKLREGLKYCACCARVLDKSQFHKRSAAKDGIDWYCKLCRSFMDKKKRAKPGYLKHRRELYRRRREVYIERQRQYCARRKLERITAVYKLKVRKVE